MEILSNLWTLISTPNEGLVNISLILCAIFIEAPLNISLISNLFSLPHNKNKKLIYILTTSFIALFAMKFLKWPFNTIINYLSTFIILLILFRMNIFKALIASVLPSIIFNLISSFLTWNPYSKLLNITYEQCATIFIYRIPYAFLTYLIVFIFILVIKYRSVTINILDNFDKKNKIIITLNFLFGIFNLVFQGIITARYTDILPIQFTILNFISLLIYFGLSFFSLAKIMSLFITEKKLENAEEHNRELQILHDSVRGFKHDFDNIVTAIGGYVKTNDMKGLSKYYSQLEGDCTKVSNLYVLNPDTINNPGVYSLLTTKYSVATEKGIHINFTFLLDLNDLSMKIYEFCRILGILLDNAIEASSECDEKILNIDFRNEAKNNRNIILIENTYKNKDVDIRDIFNKGITEKESHSGLGLWEIRQILKKNNNINLHTTKTEKYFSQQLEIYY